MCIRDSSWTIAPTCACLSAPGACPTLHNGRRAHTMAMPGAAGGLPSDGRGRCTTRCHSPRRQRLGTRLGVYCEEELGLRPPRTACTVTLPSCAVSYDLSWPDLSRQHRYAQSQRTSAFPLPKLQSALPSRQSRSRSRDGRSRSSMQYLQGTTRCPRRAVRPEILSIAESDSR